LSAAARPSIWVARSSSRARCSSAERAPWSDAGHVLELLGRCGRPLRSEAAFWRSLAASVTACARCSSSGRRARVLSASASTTRTARRSRPRLCHFPAPPLRLRPPPWRDRCGRGEAIGFAPGSRAPRSAARRLPCATAAASPVRRAWRSMVPKPSMRRFRSSTDSRRDRSRPWTRRAAAPASARPRCGRQLVDRATCSRSSPTTARGRTARCGSPPAIAEPLHLGVSDLGALGARP